MAESAPARTETEPSPSHRLLVFEICGNLCGVPASAVQEIVPMAALAQLPGQPGILAGFLNLRGSAVPVLRLNRLFQFPAATPGLHNSLIVLHRSTALLVDSVIDLVAHADGDLLPVAAGNCFAECAVAQFPYQGRSGHVLSAERLLLEKERRCVAELQAQAQRFLAELEPVR